MSINSNKEEGVRGEVTQLRRIADALEEVIRLVKQDQEKFERYKEETTERWDEPKVRENPESIQTK